MIPIDEIREAIVTGIKAYTGVAFIRANHTAPAPNYPYGSYTVTTLASKNDGTWEQRTEDGVRTDRKQVSQTWSISFQSDKYAEAAMLAAKAHEWIEHGGRSHLKAAGVTVHSVGDITNRDNVLTAGYEYKYGFDASLYVFDGTETAESDTEYIETAEITRQQEE